MMSKEFEESAKRTTRLFALLMFLSAVGCSMVYVYFSPELAAQLSITALIATGLHLIFPAGPVIVHRSIFGFVENIDIDNTRDSQK